MHFIGLTVTSPRRSQNGPAEPDLELFWDALANIFDHDRPAARGQMAAQGLVVFRHENRMGKAPAHQLLERVKVARTTDATDPARSFSDYAINVDEAGLPAGVQVIRKF